MADEPDGRGRLPLTCAAMTGNVAICQLLLRSSADVDRRGTSGASTQQGMDHCGVTALSIAAASGDVRLARLLLAAHADAELPDERGFTPQMTVACKGHLEMC